MAGVGDALQLELQDGPTIELEVFDSQFDRAPPVELELADVGGGAVPSPVLDHRTTVDGHPYTVIAGGAQPPATGFQNRSCRRPRAETIGR